MQPKPDDYDYELDQALASVVGVKSLVPADAYTAETLGTERAGNGVLIRSDDDGAVIGVNWDHHPNRQRFTIAHEIGHFLLHKGGTFIDKGTYARFRDQESGSGTVSEEKQANQFAAALLMPAQWVEDAFKEHPFDPADGSSLQDLADTFRVSTQAMMFRLSNMGLLKA